MNEQKKTQLELLWYLLKVSCLIESEWVALVLRNILAPTLSKNNCIKLQ
jgi:hypothetical protein